MDYTLRDINDIHLIFRGYRSHNEYGYWFRGQADLEWELLPKAGRKKYLLEDNRDLGRFNHWLTLAAAYSNLPEHDLEKLAIAQHHGLATRLLDWTKNPLVACYFCCSELEHTDGVVYILEPPKTLLKSSFETNDLKHINDGIYSYMPRSISPRILNQKALFTVHCPASKEISIQNSDNLTRIIIPSTLKQEVIKHINDYGIDNLFLFPDLDGLSICINKETADLIV